MIEEFDKYVSNYDLNNSDIKLKYNHSYRVMKLSRKYATLLGFNEHDIELATLIGLLHDIGRFEQLRVYNTYNDSKSVDHALYGVQELFDKNIIKKFWNNEEDYEIIKFSILNHNKYEIPFTNDERMLKHAKLIRDTDKLDILFLEGYLHELNIKATNDDISSKVLEQFYNHKSILNKSEKNINDDITITFAFVFDINYDICLKEIRKNYEYFYKQIDGKDKFEKIYLEVLKYIDERIDKNVRN